MYYLLPNSIIRISLVYLTSSALLSNDAYLSQQVGSN